MEKLSSEYGWTPNQIRKMTLEDINHYIEIISVKNQIQEAESKKSKHGNRK